MLDEHFIDQLAAQDDENEVMAALSLMREEISIVPRPAWMDHHGVRPVRFDAQPSIPQDKVSSSGWSDWGKEYWEV